MWKLVIVVAKKKYLKDLDSSQYNIKCCIFKVPNIKSIIYNKVSITYF